MDNIDAFTSDRLVEGFSQTTLDGYAGQLRRVPFQLPGTLREARDYLAAEKARGLKQSSLRPIARALKSYSRWHANEYGGDDVLAELKLPKEPRPAPGRIAPEEDVERLIVLLNGPKGSKHPNAQRDLAMIRLLSYTGMRRSELARLRIADIDFDGKRIRVDEAKGDLGRFVPLHPSPARALQRWLNRRKSRKHAESEYVFIGPRGPLTPNGIGQAIADACERNGVPRLRAHEFRRAFASKWVRQGGSDDALQLVAGWRSSAMPARYRAEHRAELAQEQYDRLFPAATARIKPGRLKRPSGQP